MYQERRLFSFSRPWPWAYFSNGPSAAASIAPNLNPTGTGWAYVNKVIFSNAINSLWYRKNNEFSEFVLVSVCLAACLTIAIQLDSVEIPPPPVQQSSLRAFAAAEADILPHISIIATAATTPFYSAADFSSGVVR